MSLSQISNELIYQYEILRARNEIRDHFSNIFIKDIYENSGQLLSLIRMKLIFATKNAGVEGNPEIVNSGQMLGEVIANLKQITTLLFPENGISTDWGFVNALIEESKVNDGKTTAPIVKVTGNPCKLNSGSSLILFRVIIEIKGIIKEDYNDESPCLEINYTKKRMKIFIRFKGAEIPFSSKRGSRDDLYIDALTIEERVKLIKGIIGSKEMKDGRQEVLLTVSI